MSRNAAAPDPTLSSRAYRNGLALAAVSTLLAATAVACGTDSGEEDPTASDATTSTAASESATGSEESSAPSDSASASATTTAPGAGDPVPSPVIDKAVKAALAAGFPALVPAGVPPSWTVVSATFSPRGGGRWRIALTAPGGAPVRLVQTQESLEDLVSRELGREFEETGTVDLGSAGTGRWKVYSGGEVAGLTTAIATRIAGTSALVGGPDQDTVVELADQLLTAEDGGGGGGGYE